MSTLAPAAPLTTAQKAGAAAAGALVGLGVLYAGDSLIWGVLTYPFDGGAHLNNIAIVTGTASLAAAVVISWLAFRWVGALRPWLAGIIGVLLAVPVTYALKTIASIIMGVTSGNFAVFATILYILGALACAAVYLVIARGIRRRDQRSAAV